MPAKLVNQHSPDTRYSARFVESFTIKLPVEQIDLSKWIIEMTELDYVSHTPAHLAMNSHFHKEVLLMTNVENIVNETIMQHCELKKHSSRHIQLY